MMSSCDILRIHAFWQFYRYKRNITRIFRIDICRIVGYHRQPSGFLPIWLLISAIFYPAEYRKLARVDVRGNACTVINKRERKRSNSKDLLGVVTESDFERLGELIGEV